MMIALIVFPVWITVDILKTKNNFFKFYQWFEKQFNQQRWVSVPAVIVVVINWIWNISKGL